ncbi:MAG TPA: response regulator [Anaerolineales bacterium]|nr:response regulator [Anaerolineales bacterium]
MEKTTNFTSKKILVIEDEPDIAKLVVTHLQNYGFRTFHSAEGAAGIRLAQAEKPDLVILDILLPDMDGWEVLEEIKKRRIATRIIMLTKIEGVASIIKFIRAGACDYVNKPFDIEDLRMRVDRALEMENTINLHFMNAFPPEVEKLMLEIEQNKTLPGKSSKSILKSMEYLTLAHEREQLSKQLKSEQRKQKELKSRLLEYERKLRLQNFGFRIFYILLAVLITWLFFQTKLITDAKLLFLLPIILFFLLLFPIERIRSISAKHSSTEAQVDLEDKPENEPH